MGGWGGGRSKPSERKRCSQRDDSDSELQSLPSELNRTKPSADLRCSESLGSAYQSSRYFSGTQVGTFCSPGPTCQMSLVTRVGTGPILPRERLEVAWDPPWEVVGFSSMDMEAPWVEPRPLVPAYILNTYPLSPGILGP